MASKVSKRVAKYELANKLLKGAEYGSLYLRSGRWKVHESVLYYGSHSTCTPVDNGSQSQVGGKRKIAGFDFDQTLCSGGLTWQVASGKTRQVLQGLHDDGFELCVFSNQKHIGKNSEQCQMDFVIERTLSRFQTFISWLKPVPVKIFIATARGDVDDNYRKPNSGMWNLMTSLHEAQIDFDESFFVGNAAGRHRDLTNADKLFAENVGIRFFTEDVLHEW